MMVRMNEENGRNVILPMASEIPMTAKFNEKSSLPGSIWLLKKLQSLYPDTIVPVPTAQHRHDFLSGRTVAMRKIMRGLTGGGMVLISPEGHTEVDGVMSPVETYHEGSGRLILLHRRWEFQRYRWPFGDLWRR